MEHEKEVRLITFNIDDSFLSFSAKRLHLICITGVNPAIQVEMNCLNRQKGWFFCFLKFLTVLRVY